MLYERKKDLEKQGYRLVGKHSAIKTCHWCKKSLKQEGVCYKHTFYDIASWRCIQASVTLDICNLKCQWCWRDVNLDIPKTFVFDDKPRDILDGFIKEQKKALEGFKGNEKVSKRLFNESMDPKHVALSLTGDACLYPKLPNLIKKIKDRNMTSFLVTNGTFTSMLKRLRKEQPTQLYITLPAPNEKIFNEVCKPLGKNLCSNILDSLVLLGDFNRGTVRMTLAKGMNMCNVEEYASLLKDVDFKFLELKGAMPIGDARYRMTVENMPYHSEVKEFAKKIAKLNKLNIVDEKEDSRVVLLMKENKDRKIKF